MPRKIVQILRLTVVQAFEILHIAPSPLGDSNPAS